MPKLIIFSDIDGTLIDFESYSYAAVESTVARLVDRRIPLVLCSSKTRAEQAVYREALAIPDPYIVENGSAIFIPPGCFGADAPLVIELGVGAAFIRAAVHAVREQTGLAIQGYGDLSVAEVSRVTGLDAAAAARARQREYSETIVTPLSAEMLETLRTALTAYDLSIVSGGKFHTIISARSDKGAAVRQLAQLYRARAGHITTVGLGDSANDAPLLTAVDRPFLVQKPGGHWQDVNDLVVTRVPAVGPAGWRQTVEALLEESTA